MRLATAGKAEMGHKCSITVTAIFYVRLQSMISLENCLYYIDNTLPRTRYSASIIALALVVTFFVVPVHVSAQPSIPINGRFSSLVIKNLNSPVPGLGARCCHERDGCMESGSGMAEFSGPGLHVY